MNSLSRWLLRDLRDCAEALPTDKAVRAVLLTGIRRAASVPAPTSRIRTVRPVPASRWDTGSRRGMRNHFHPVVELWARLPVPLVVAVNGIAAGTGVSLALSGT